MSATLQPERYDLQTMLREIKQDEREELRLKKRLSQEDINNIIMNRRPHCCRRDLCAPGEKGGKA